MTGQRGPADAAALLGRHTRFSVPEWAGIIRDIEAEGYAVVRLSPDGDLRAALAAGLADALTIDWPGDTRLSAAPAIADYLMKRPEVRAARAAAPATPPTPDEATEFADRAASLLRQATGPDEAISDNALVSIALSLARLSGDQQAAEDRP